AKVSTTFGGGRKQNCGRRLCNSRRGRRLSLSSNEWRRGPDSTASQPLPMNRVCKPLIINISTFSRFRGALRDLNRGVLTLILSPGGERKPAVGSWLQCA